MNYLRKKFFTKTKQTTNKAMNKFDIDATTVTVAFSLFLSMVLSFIFTLFFFVVDSLVGVHFSLSYWLIAYLMMTFICFLVSLVC